MNEIKKRNFQSGKNSYYKHLSGLMRRIDKDIAINSYNKTEDAEQGTETESLVQKLEEKMKIREELEQTKCEKCEINTFKYVCPRCKIKYCSVDCFKAHSTDCTEEFYKKHVEDELKNIKVDQTEANRFKTVLREDREKYNEDAEETVDSKVSESRVNHLEKILDKLNNNNFDFATDLTPGDWIEFNKFLSGYNNNDIWKPYWESLLDQGFEPSLEVLDRSFLTNLDANSIKYLKDLELNEYCEQYENQGEDSNENEFEDYLASEETNENETIMINNIATTINRDVIVNSIILKYEAIPGIKNLTKVAGSSKNLNTIAYIIFCSVYVFKLYNGDINSNLEEIVEILFNICDILYRKDLVFDTVVIAYTEFLNRIEKLHNLPNTEGKLIIINSLPKLLSNKFYLVETLFRVYEMVHKYGTSYGNTKEVTLAKHKIIYLLSFMKDISSRIFTELLEEILTFDKNNRNDSTIGSKLRSNTDINSHNKI